VMCVCGGVFTITANLEKSFDQISNAVSYIASTGAFPLIMGRDHSIGFLNIHGIASVTSK
jgi:agmatinase